MLWDVAYSDRVLTGDEDALVRRVASLIYMSDWERWEAKRRVRGDPAFANPEIYEFLPPAPA
jgi:Tellurite resistance protein TerB